MDLYRRTPIAEAAPASVDSDEAADLIDNHPDSHDTFRQLESREAIEHALLTLEAEQRDAVLLHDLEGYTADEMAKIMDTSVGTVKSRLHRAREKLERVLEGPS